MKAGNSPDQQDLKQIKGIGPKIEARLKDAGITNLSQLARTPVNEIQAALEGLQGGYDASRITREGWLSEAAALAAVAADARGETEPAKRVRHHFTVEVQLAVASREILSSKVVHVQTSDEATWGGWDAQRVIAFIEDRSGARRSLPAVTEEEGSTAIEPAPEHVRTTPDKEAGLELHTFAMVPASGPEAPPHGSITAALSFDAAPITLPADQTSRAKIDIYARHPPLGKSFLVGSTTADIRAGEQIQIQIPCDLPPNGYPVALFAAVQLFAGIRAGRKASSVLPSARLTVS